MPIAQSAMRSAGDSGAPVARSVQILRSSIQDHSDSGEIDFSIVIPAHNRPKQLGQCLEAIATLKFPLTRYEVIVVDDGSTDDLAPVVVPLLDRLRITLLRQPNSGPAAARNAGAAVATGRYVVFTDDDCRPAPEWLRALADKLAVNPECAIGGKIANGLPENLFSTASQVMVEYLYRQWNRDPDDAFFIASNNLAVARARFVEIGGFDVTFPLAAAEDREWCSRWRSLRGRLIYAPDAVVHHFHAHTLKTFLRQHFNYGRGAMVFRAVRRRSATRLEAAPTGWFYLPLMKFAITRDLSPRGAAVAILVGLAQTVLPLGYLRQSFASRAQTPEASIADHSPETAPTRNAGEIASNGQ
jgi:glycosyltransferase involved in cell wall biosynthesis